MSRLLCLVLALAGVGCSIPLLPTGRTVSRPATLSFYGDSARILLPDTVRAAERFVVEITSYGGGCVSQGSEQVRVSGLSADITVHDLERVPGPGGACTDILQRFQHRATLRFDAPGRATVRIHGRREPGNLPLTLQREVEVRPRSSD